MSADAESRDPLLVHAPSWEDDEDRWPHGALWSHALYSCVVWRILGWATEPDESGIEQRNGNVIAVMVGDKNRHFSEDPAYFTPTDILTL